VGIITRGGPREEPRMKLTTRYGILRSPSALVRWRSVFSSGAGAQEEAAILRADYGSRISATTSRILKICRTRGVNGRIAVTTNHGWGSRPWEK